MSCEKEKRGKFLRHPIVVAFVSTVIFGIVISSIGSWLQHKNWIKQEQISRQKTQQEKLFDKKAQLVEEIFYNIKNREINAWNLWGACQRDDYERFKNYWEQRTIIISRHAALRHSIAIYFGYSEEDELLKTIWEIQQILHETEAKIGAHPDCKKITKTEMNDLSKIESKYESKLIEILKKRHIYMLKTN